jgi:hypothetical protein
VQPVDLMSEAKAHPLHKILGNPYESLGTFGNRLDTHGGEKVPFFEFRGAGQVAWREFDEKLLELFDYARAALAKCPAQ